MTAPRHLWSGDWELESSARRDELAAGRNRIPAPEPERPEAPPLPPTLTLRERLRRMAVAVLAWLRSGLRRLRNVRLGSRRQRRIALLVAGVMVVGVGAAFALASALNGGSGASQPAAAQAGSEAWLGIDVASSPSGGVMVVNVVPGSPAYWAGMEAGDMINRINGHQILTPSDVSAAIGGTQPGKQITIQFQGSGTTYTSHVKLANRPAGYP